MSKKAVKRGGKQHTEYLHDLMSKEEEREHQNWWRSRQYVLDAVTIALGQMLEEDYGWELEKIYEAQRIFNRRYIETELEVAYMTTNEKDEDVLNKNKVGVMWVTQEKIDRAIQQYVAPENFVPFEKRYYDCQEQPFTAKDEMIINQRRIIDRLDDQIIKLKGQLKLRKVQNGKT